MITDRIGLHSVLLPLQIEFNRVDNPSLPEANQLAIYKHGQGFEPGTTVNKSSYRSGQRSNHSATLPPPVTNYKEG